MHQAPMDTFEASKPDQFHQSLSSAWASFLSAQHCSREVNALRKTLDKHIQQASLSITSLQSDVANRHDFLATAVAESKSNIEQQTVELREARTLHASFTTLQQEITRDREETARKTTELCGKVEAQQDDISGLRLTVTQEMDTLREQHRLALGKLEFLEEELRTVRAEKAASEQKLVSLEDQINTTTQTRQELSEDMVGFLEDILGRRDDLIQLLNKQDRVISAQRMSLPLNPIPIPHSQTHATLNESAWHEPPLSQAIHTGEHDSGDNQPTGATKRKLEEPLHSQPKRPASSSDDAGQDIRSLYLIFRDRYKANPPKSDTTFIWEFISSIESQAMSKHIQESLAAILPEHVTPSRGTRRKNPKRHVDISKGLTWRKFREALVRIPGPP